MIQVSNVFHQVNLPFTDPRQDSLTVTQFLAGARSWAMDVVRVEPGKREFGGIKRQADGSFTEADLVNLINVATEKPGAAFGARSTPLVMKPIEMLGIQSQRQWGIATLNEVRAKFNLVPHKTFRKPFQKLKIHHILLTLR